MTLRVVAIGWSTTVQDGGRPGRASIGVPSSGALDQPVHALVNRLVGNDQTAAVLETAGGLQLRATRSCVVATSAELAVRSLRPHEELQVDPARGRLWGYVAVRGGFVFRPVLGSVSQDTLSGLGPPPLRLGQELTVGPDPGTELVVDHAPRRAKPEAIGVWPGPRADWFGADGFERFIATPWRVSPDVSRVGMRLDGPALRRSTVDELPSEALLTGSIQVPPDGRPTVMLADHPTTGGYPVIAVVDPASLVTVAQSPPGTTLRLRSGPPARLLTGRRGTGIR